MECELLTEAECQQQGGAFQGAETLCHVDACGIGPAEGWSTYQHDAQRTGRASATVPDSPRRIWTQILGDSGTLTNTPTIGPDGSIYAASTSEDFVALKPDGSLRWKKWIFPRAPATVRADGNVLVPASSGLVRLNHVDGSELWGAPTKSDRGDVLPGALDADGNYYGGGTGGLFKRSADGTVLWSQEVGGDLYSHVALGTDGGVHASNGHSTFKLDPLSGLEVWSLSTGNESGGPAIGSTGTVYCTVDPNQLWARNPDGSEVWTHTFADTDFTIDVPFTGSPAIGADGTLYVPGHYSYPFRPAVVAVGADGMEKWMYVSTSESTWVPAPVIDGAGTVLFQDGASLVGLSPSDGSVLWHVESEICRSAPAIADDGTVYVVTMDGRLIAYGDGCPENVVQQTEYSYRVAARVGDVILGHNVNSLGGFDLQENGRVSFEAGVAAGGFAFVEQSDGAFEAIGPGMILGGQQLTEVRLPRIDANGNVYLPASTAESGPVVYVNGQVFVQTDPGGSGPVTLLSFASTEYLEHDDAGRLLVFGRRIGDSWPALLSIDTATHDVTPEIQQYEVIDGFRVESITPDGAHGLGDDGTVVAEVESTGRFAIVTQDSLIVRSGDMVGGHRIDRPREPRRDSAGGIHYRTGPIFQYLPSGEQRMIHALLDTIDGEPATTYLHLDGNRRGDIAYVAQLLAQRRGVFVNNKAVAIAEVTEIAGQRVSGIESAYPRWVSINEAGQVAFVVQFEDGTDALIVATPQLPLDANANGAVDLDDYALFSDCLTGPGMYVTPECAIFDVNGDCQVDLVDWGLFQEIFGGTDCNGNGSADILDVYLDRSEDCNANRIPDECDIASGESADLNTNGVPDECDPDCNGNGVPDGLDIAAGTSADCNANAVPDECDVTSGTSADCNANGIPDSCDIASGTSTDCTGNQVPDTCEPDCDGNGVADSCDIHDGTESDCDGSGVPDSCEIAQGAVPDCNGNGIPDDCDADCDMNGVPDDCEPFVDCNANGVTDACDIANGTSFDWNRNGQPDECEPDCDGDTLPDDCELWWNDCNGNGVPDDCESAAADCNANGILDECELHGYQLAYTISGEAEGDLFGYAMDAVGDVTGDGLTDVAISALYAGPLFEHAGRVYLYGLTPTGATLLSRVDGYDRFGWDVTGLGDANGDGIPDFAVGSPYDEQLGYHEGMVVILSGADRTIGGEFMAHPGLLRSIDRVGTFTGSQVGVLRESGRLLVTSNEDAGRAYVVDAATGADIAILIGGGIPYNRIASDGALTEIGDLVGGDGVSDFAVTGENNLNGSVGTIFIIDGTYSVSYPQRITAIADRLLVGTNLGDQIGRESQAIAGSPDLTGDGVRDVVVGAQMSDAPGNTVGAVLVYDGATAEVAYRITGPAAESRFGTAIVAPGDVDGDGFGDFVAGAPGESGVASHLGLVRLYSGATGSLLQTFQDGQQGFGERIAAVGDLNGDGIPDLAVANHVADSNRGAVYIYLSGPRDCDGNGVPDDCDPDCSGNGVPDACEPDCNGNTVADDCDLQQGTSQDCNANDVPDECDLAAGTSGDLNGNGVPDECEPDCNENGVPDAWDISTGASNDVNANGIPDECEEDCNHNGAPDPHDIASGSSTDTDTNGVPDDCQVDCNDNGVWDYLDVEQGTVEDCNQNWNPDECDIAAYTPGRLYWASGGDNVIRTANLDGSGMTTVLSGSGELWSVAVDPLEGKVYWTSYAGKKIWRANLDGTGVEIIQQMTDGRPLGIALDGAGEIYWCDNGKDWINRGPVTGGSFENLIWGLVDPEGIALDIAGGKMYWTEPGTNEIRRANLDGTGDERITGSGKPRQIALDVGAAMMYWADSEHQTIRRARFDGTGQEDILTGLGMPYGIALDLRAGRVYWSDWSMNKIQRARLDGTGVEDMISSGLNQPHMMDLVDAIGSPDCNGNGVPDECDLSSGTAPDCNLNAVPDSCDIATGTSGDCNENAIPDECDIAAGTSEDCNENGIPDPCDIASGTSTDLNGNGIPDECDTDCNENGVPDEVDISGGTSADCNANAVPDECDIAAGTSDDCNENGIPDSCDIASGTSLDEDENGVPDECDTTYLFWADQQEYHVGRSLPDGTERVTIVSNTSVSGVALDSFHRRIYWIDANLHELRRANLDGLGAETIRTGLPSLATCPAFDHVNNRVLWCVEADWSNLEACNADGSGPVTLVTDLRIPNAIAIDHVHGKVYWIGGNGRIGRANLDGTNAEHSLVSLGTPGAGIAIDAVAGHLYYTCSLQDKIYRRDLDGSNEQVILSGLTRPTGIAIAPQEGKIYWGDNSNDKIRRANLDGTGVEEIITDGLDTPEWLAFGPQPLSQLELDCNGNGITDSSEVSGPRLYVDAQATGLNTGADWTNALTELSVALCMVDNVPGVTEIWVAAGTYRPDGGTGDRTVSFELPGGVEIYGGFAGGETSLDQRDVSANPTILSGDIGIPGDISDNSYHVVYVDGMQQTAVLDGLVITDGHADGSAGTHNVGAGVRVIASNVVLRNCAIRGNNASGNCGGIQILTGTALTLDNCVISGNTSGNRGGGIQNYQSTITATNCTIVNNAAAAEGGGLFMNTVSTSLTNCIVWGNTAMGGVSDESAQIHILDGTLAVDFSCVQYWSGTYGGTGNIGLDPLFVTGPWGDYYLSQTAAGQAQQSPCVDAGDPATALPPGTTRTDGSPDTAPVDMGYHY